MANMDIEAIYKEFDLIGNRMQEKASLARSVAKKARKKGNLKKWDKFNSVARVYEMMYAVVMPLSAELINHTSADFQKSYCELPFDILKRNP